MKQGKKIKIFLSDIIHPDGISLLRKNFLVFDLAGKTDKHILNVIKKNAIPTDKNSVLVVRSTRKINKLFINTLSKETGVKLICTVSAGFDNIDTKKCRRYGIDVINTEGANSISAAEFTMGVILASTKSIITADVNMKRGKFDNSVFNNSELYGKTIGVIGVGNVGSKVVKLAKAFDMKILANDIDPAVRKKYSSIKFVSLNTLLSSCDIVTIHTPLDDSTKNLINSANLKLMRSNVLLVNCARGGILDEKALKSHLKRNKLFYSALDVFTGEPLFDKEFSKIRGVILTPHLAGKTEESKRRMSVLAAEKIAKYFGKNRRTLKFVN